MRILTISTGPVANLFETENGQPQRVKSAIRKQAVSTLAQPLPILLKPLGLRGDEQADLSVHGGLDKALYVYPSEHYAFWQETLRRESAAAAGLSHGHVGENLTIEGLHEEEVWVGDIWQVGTSVQLRVAAMRQPCFKFNARMGYKGASKAMVQSGRCGWYMEVLQTGHLRAGDPIQVQAGERNLSIAMQNHNLRRNPKQMDLL